MSDFKHLVDHAIIDAANARHAAAITRLAAAEGALTDATAAHRAATEASELAAVSNDTAAAHDAERGLEIAERTLRVATKLHAAAQRERHEAFADIPAARGVAHRPVFKAAVEARLAAAASAARAKALLVEAEAQWVSATLVMHACAAYPVCSPHPDWQDRSFARHGEETSLWRDPHSWWLGLDENGAAR